MGGAALFNPLVLEDFLQLPLAAICFFYPLRPHIINYLLSINTSVYSKKLLIMTSQQSLQLFDIVNRNFKSEADARMFVTEIDTLITAQSKEETKELATKKDLDLVKYDLIKWMFSFWVTLILLILGAFFLKK